MRVLLWHGWLLDGSGSNVYTARVAEVLVSAGHDVLLLCQEPHPERHPWIEAHGSIDEGGPSALEETGGSRGRGRCILLRPAIGSLLPVFVVDEYEGFEVKTFLDLTDTELAGYLRRNEVALRAAVSWHRSDVVIVGHAIPGATVAARALPPGSYLAKIHGSDLEYAIREQVRYRELAREGLTSARVVVGATADVLRRCAELVPGMRTMTAIPPGVDVRAFHPLPARASLLETAEALDRDPATASGRPSELDGEVGRALARRDAAALDELATTYDQTVPDPAAASRLRRLSWEGGPIVGYLGKLIVQKGPALLLLGRALSRHAPRLLVVGFGLHREWLSALSIALREADEEAIVWLAERDGLETDVSREAVARMRSVGETAFTGVLDHRYAPGAVAAMDVLVVPSILPEAFGMVAAEGAAAGALPLVARHSGLAELAGALEDAVDRPGLFSFDPRPDAASSIARGIDVLLDLPQPEVEGLRTAIGETVAREWSWEATATRLLRAAR